MLTRGRASFLGRRSFSAKPADRNFSSLFMALPSDKPISKVSLLGGHARNQDRFSAGGLSDSLRSEAGAQFLRRLFYQDASKHCKRNGYGQSQHRNRQSAVHDPLHLEENRRVQQIE